MIRSSRTTLSRSCRAAGSPESMRCKSSMPVMTRPLTPTSRSPARRPAAWAGPRRHLDNLHCQLAQQIVFPHQPPGQRSHRGNDSQGEAANPAAADQFGHDPLRRRGGNGKPEPLRHGNNGRVHAYHAAARIQQGAAGTARVQRSGVLNDVFDQPSLVAAHRPPQAAHHARRNGRLEAERIAHGDHQLSHLETFRVAEFGHGQVAGCETDQGQVGGRVVADQVGGQRVALRRDRTKLAAAVDHMAVGQGIAVGGQDKTRARSAAVRAGGPTMETTAGPTWRTTAITARE